MFVTGLLLGAPDSADVYEIKNLRSVHLGDILHVIREAASSIDPAFWSTPVDRDGFTFADVLRSNVEPANARVRRGPHGDPEAALRTLAVYEDALAGRLPPHEGAPPDGKPLARTQAVLAVSRAMFISESQVYRRLAKARSMRRQEEDA